MFYGVGGLEIGDNTRIAAYSIVTRMNHMIEDASVPIWKQEEKRLEVRIGDDVWVGAYAKALDGVTIGDGCVIGAGSVVTTSLPPFRVAVGAPARVIRRRGADEAAYLARAAMPAPL